MHACRPAAGDRQDHSQSDPDQDEIHRQAEQEDHQAEAHQRQSMAACRRPGFEQPEPAVREGHRSGQAKPRPAPDGGQQGDRDRHGPDQVEGRHQQERAQHAPDDHQVERDHDQVGQRHEGEGQQQQPGFLAADPQRREGVAAGLEHRAVDRRRNHHAHQKGRQQQRLDQGHSLLHVQGEGVHLLRRHPADPAQHRQESRDEAVQQDDHRDFDEEQDQHAPGEHGHGTMLDQQESRRKGSSERDSGHAVSPQTAGP